MRLVCPRCGAQYEIDDSAIPAGGRDVECSACDNVWRAMRPEVALDPAAFDPAERPTLNRPLSDSVIEILREEAAREMDARAADRKALRDAERAGTAALLETDTAAAPPPALQVPAADPVVAEFAPADAADDLPGAVMAAEPATSSPAPAPAPAAVAPSGRRGYRAGFQVAVVAALCAVALYAVAPRVGEQSAVGQSLMHWRGEVDQGRDWLQAKADELLGRNE